MINSKLSNQCNENIEMAIQSLPERTKLSIRQAAATMEISNMPLTQQCVQNMIDLCSGTKMSEEIVSEICGQYRTHSVDQKEGE